MLLIRESKLTTLFLACPRTASSAAEAALKAAFGPSVLEIHPTHGVVLDAGTRPPWDRVVTTMRSPVSFYLSWINYVMNSPAHWPLGSAVASDWSAGQLIRGLIEPEDGGRGFPLSPLFLSGQDEADLRLLLSTGRSLWQAATMLYGGSYGGGVLLVDQGRLGEGLSEVFECTIEPPQLNVTATVWPARRALLSDVPMDVLEEVGAVDGPLAAQLGYEGVLSERAARAVTHFPSPTC